MAEFDLLPKITPYLDKHLLFPLLEHVQKLQIYPEDEVVKAQLSMLSRAKLVDFEIEKHKLLHKSDEVPPGAAARRSM
ncbi:putative eukaryotic translation initiation factor 3 subunit [Baffinella frigidus]|nr:putative eukaryotic translation initiation factor 3 subunit [Cryptophyta sp. CCMP2293]